MFSLRRYYPDQVIRVDLSPLSLLLAPLITIILLKSLYYCKHKRNGLSLKCIYILGGGALKISVNIHATLWGEETAYDDLIGQSICDKA